MSQTRKQIAFDLDTNAMKRYYPTENWNNGYEVIRRFMQKNGFKWLQGSVYASEKPVPHIQVQHIVREMIRENPWLNLCMRDCRETHIMQTYNLNYLFDKNATLQKRAERSASRGQGTLSGYMAEIAKKKAAKEKTGGSTERSHHRTPTPGRDR